MSDDSSTGLLARRIGRPSRRVHSSRLTRTGANIVGAGGAAWFAGAGYHHFHHTHSLVGAVFFAEQLWVVGAYLVRRGARTVSDRPRDWLLALGATCGGLAFEPAGAHPHWGVVAGLDIQLVGLALCLASFVALGRSFGFAAAQRGVKQHGPYGVVRHPLYASYFLLQGGYVLQSVSWRNLLVMTFVCGCNVGRVVVEERLLSRDRDYREYRRRVRWRLLPGVW